MPAYHCGALVEPAVWLGAGVDFYRIGLDLKADLDDIERKCTGTTRCLVVVHYFGFPQPLSDFVDLCRRKSLALVEDCAHAFFGRAREGVLGSVGDFSMASAKKFFPVEDGGVLIGRDPLPSTELRAPELSAELRSLARGVQAASDFGQLGIAGTIASLPFRARDWLRGAETRQAVPAGSTGYRWFQPNEVERSGTRVSSWIMEHTNKTRLVARRRAGFARLLHGLADVRGGHPLYRELPDGVVPYMFPFVLKDPDVAFRALKSEGVPLLRWEEVAHSDCPVSERYLSQLIQIPCHQELKDDAIEWIVGTVRKTLD